MKLKVKFKFKYKCEIDINPEELEKVRKNLNDQRNIDVLSDDINEMFLTGDGRTESGGITEYSFEVEDEN